MHADEIQEYEIEDSDDMTSIGDGLKSYQGTINANLQLGQNHDSPTFGMKNKDGSRGKPLIKNAFASLKIDKIEPSNFRSPDKSWEAGDNSMDLDDAAQVQAVSYRGATASFQNLMSPS